MINVKELIPIRFVGNAYDKHRLPVESLSDLIALAEAIKISAKEKYKEKHPERLRMPNNFKEKFRLFIDEIQEGSAVPIMKLQYEDELDNDFVTSHEEATNEIKNILRQAASSQETGIQTWLPEGAFKHLFKFGKGISKDCHIEINDNSNIIKVDFNTREYLFKQNLNKIQTRRSTLIFNGELFKVDFSTFTCCIELDDGTLKSFSFSENISELIRSSLRKDVRILVNGQVDKHNDLIGQGSILIIDHFDNNQFIGMNKAIDKLKELQDGWYWEGLGKALNPNVIKLILDFCQKCIDKGLPPPFIFPGIDKNEVYLEWPTLEGLITVSFFGESKEANLYGSIEEIDFNIQDDEKVDYVINNIAEKFIIH
ncbi:hypothetical protein GCL60_09705 [Silvanigrella paludirubra]|uniref:Uncharacterized protein n=1 Tax=Silvanigrella paludirubra TaxID=2499159 RepID=A0A6N6VT07_9BACT|nr:hypothetical protein [Silvanigrella paludirubra]KAB8039120.1 hypothetical protein GCL60_09705 [Silvanigrella paludirubra]